MPQQQPPQFDFNPGAVQGPFTGMLTGQQPTMGQQQQPTGWTTKTGSILNVVTNFLGGIEKGRVKNYEREQQQEAKQRGVVMDYINMKLRDPDLTDEGRQALEQKGMQYMARTVLKETDGKGKKKGGDQPQGIMGHISGMFHDVALGMVGGQLPKKGEEIDPAQFMSQVDGIAKQPQFSKQAAIEGAQKQIQSILQQVPQGADQQAVTRALQGDPKQPGPLAVLQKYMDPASFANYKETVMGGYPTYEQAEQTRGMQEVFGGGQGQSLGQPPPAARPQSGAPANAQGTQPAGQPAGGARPGSVQAQLFGQPVQVGPQALAYLHKVGFKPSVSYIIGQDGKQIGQVEEYAPGKYRQFGTNQALNMQAMQTGGYTMTTDKPADRAQHWQRIGEEVVNGKRQVRYQNFMTGEDKSVELGAKPEAGGETAVDKLLNREEDRFQTKSEQMYQQLLNQKAALDRQVGAAGGIPDQATADARKIELDREYATYGQFINAMHENRTRQILGQRPTRIDPELTGTIAERKHNPGNLKIGGVIREFQNDDQGYQALLADVKNKIDGKSVTGLKPTSTLSEFFKVYAPEEDGNDPQAYTNQVAADLGVKPDAKLSSLKGKEPDLARAIAHFEGFKNYAQLGQSTPPPEARAGAGSSAGRVTVSVDDLLK